MLARWRNKEEKTRGQRLREELSQTADHARAAAGHAAGGVGESVGPRMVAVRDRMGPAVRGVAHRGWGTTVAVFTPLSAAAQSRIEHRRERQRKAARAARRRRRMPMYAGLLAAGMAVGVVAAAVMRRRREEESEAVAAGIVEPSGTGEATRPVNPPVSPVTEPVSVTDNQHR